MALTYNTNRMAGHGLVAEGAAFLDSGIRSHDPAGEGAALCQCGERSPALRNRARRKTWHRDHKADVRAGGTGDVGAS